MTNSMLVPPPCCEDGLALDLPFDEERLALIARGLAHPARVRILEQFVDCTPRIVNEIVEGCELAQSTVSEHLRILRDAGVLYARKDGPRTWYCMRRSVMRAFSAAVETLAEDKG